MYVCIYVCMYMYVCMYVGAVKLGLLCELYTRNKKEMSKDEKHEVLEYVRGRYV